MFICFYQISQTWTLIWNDFNIIWLLLVVIWKNVLLTEGKIIFPGIKFQIQLDGFPLIFNLILIKVLRVRCSLDLNTGYIRI